jgi:uncharacterized membrane protein YhaH (DUF805 family)
MTQIRRWRDVTASCWLLVLALLLPVSVQAVKFELAAMHNPHQKCVWNYAMADTLVVIT